MKIRKNTSLLPTVRIIIIIIIIITRVCVHNSSNFKTEMKHRRPSRLTETSTSPYERRMGSVCVTSFRHVMAGSGVARECVCRTEHRFSEFFLSFAASSQLHTQ